MTKNRKADQLPIAADLAAALTRCQAELLAHGNAPSPTDLVFATTPARSTWKGDLKRADVPYVTSDGIADFKATRKTFGSHLTRAGADPMLVVLLMRHTPPAGAALTFGTYGDPEALLARKRQALDQMTRWYEAESEKCSAGAARATRTAQNAG